MDNIAITIHRNGNAKSVVIGAMVATTFRLHCHWSSGHTQSNTIGTGTSTTKLVRRAWMRQGRWMLCACGACLLLIAGWAHGIDHKTGTKPPPAHQAPVQCSGLRTTIRTYHLNCFLCYKTHSKQYTSGLRGRIKYNCALIKNSQQDVQLATLSLVNRTGLMIWRTNQ